MPGLRQLTRPDDEPTDPTTPTDTAPREPTEPTDADEPGGTAGTEPAASAGEATTTDPTFDVGGTSVTVSGDPTDAEAAAVAAVVAEHLRAEADTATPAESDSGAGVDPWCLAGRFGIRSPCRVPDTPASGSEWKVAGRAATW
jgi:hypothetical protein